MSQTFSRLRGHCYAVIACVFLIQTVIWWMPAHPAMASQASPPPLRSLALPRATFPAGASIHAAPATAQQVRRVTGLHAPDTPGRRGGYLQTATWWTHHHYVSLTYGASVFDTPDDAAAFRADAVASLIELGQPVQVATLSSTVFRVLERDGHADLLAIQQQGAVEAEILLRLQRRTPLSTGQQQFRLASARSQALIGRYANAFPAPPPPSPGNPVPFPVYVSPWGAGPVIKSPSLMSVTPSMVPASATLDPGNFRSQSPPLAPRAYLHPAIVPPNPLTRYAETATVNNRPLYSSTALYPSVAAALTAFAAVQKANRSKPWLQAVDASAFPTPADTDITVWQGHGETIVLACSQNVLIILTGETDWPALQPVLHSLFSTIPTWLHTQGTQIVDVTGSPVRLDGLNWYGAESPDFVVGGLDYQPYEAILQTVQRSGYDAIRLPISNQLVEQNPIVTDHLGANRELVGLHALDILDRIINYAGALGLRVILDDHRSEAGWSAEVTGLWYTDDYPDSAFQQDWLTMTQRYAVNNAVAGMDLRNEPHGTAAWGGADPTVDWHAAAERVGNAVLGINPHLLVIVEGVQFFGGFSYWWGGNLMGVASNPIVLQLPDGTSAQNQLVYSIHDYGPNNCASGCPWFNSTTTYDSLVQVWEQRWGYITADPAQPYAAPVMVGEFGTCNYNPTCGNDTTPGSQGQWFRSLVQYLGQKQLNWIYWSVNGSQSSGPARVYGAHEWYGFLSQDWAVPYPWLAQELSTIQSPMGNSSG